MFHLGYRTLAAFGLLTLLPLGCGGRVALGSPTGTGGMASAGTNSAGATGVALPQDEQFVAAECPDVVTLMADRMSTTCSTSSLAATFHYLNILIVVDRSASLALSGLPADGRSNWTRAVSALRFLLRDTESLQRYGLVLFPALGAAPGVRTENTLSCNDSLAFGLRVDVPISPAAISVPAINELLTKTTPSGSSPVADALAFAYDYFTRGEGAKLTGWKHVLLVTDGGANCNAELTCAAADCTTNLEAPTIACGAAGGNCCDARLTERELGPSACLDDQRATEQLSRLSAAHIKTFVLGGSANERYKSALNALALTGGMPNAYGPNPYYSTQEEVEITFALANVTTSLVKACVVPLENTPADPNKLSLRIDCTIVPRQMTDGAVNWRYELDAAGNPRVVLEGEQCLRINATGVNRIDALLDCSN